jgi:hypothetical protein
MPLAQQIQNAGTTTMEAAIIVWAAQEMPYVQQETMGKIVIITMILNVILQDVIRLAKQD